MPNRPQRIVVVMAVTAVVLFAMYQYWSSRRSFGRLSNVHSEARWSCPMHPQLRRAEKGTCPSCGMPLVRIAPNDNSIDGQQPLSLPDSAIDQIKVAPE